MRDVELFPRYVPGLPFELLKASMLATDSKWHQWLPPNDRGGPSPMR